MFSCASHCVSIHPLTCEFICFLYDSSQGYKHLNSTSLLVTLLFDIEYYIVCGKDSGVGRLAVNIIRAELKRQSRIWRLNHLKIVQDKKIEINMLVSHTRSLSNPLTFPALGESRYLHLRRYRGMNEQGSKGRCTLLGLIIRPVHNTEELYVSTNLL